MFFSMLPGSRQNSKYCDKFGKIDRFNIEDIVAAKSLNQFQRIFYERERFVKAKREHGYKKRYCWVNFHSIFYRGTLEIRAHSGTINYRKILNWFSIHLYVLKFIKSKSINQLMKMKTDKRTFLNIFPKSIQLYILERWKKFPMQNKETQLKIGEKEVRYNVSNPLD